MFWKISFLFSNSIMRRHHLKLITCCVLIIILCEVIQMKTQPKAKMIRLCLWTRCQAKFSRCPVLFKQSAIRNCKLDSGEIGFYSRCCLYEESAMLDKSGNTLPEMNVGKMGSKSLFDRNKSVRWEVTQKKSPQRNSLELSKQTSSTLIPNKHKQSCTV